MKLRRFEDFNIEWIFFSYLGRCPCLPPYPDYEMVPQYLEQIFADPSAGIEPSPLASVSRALAHRATEVHTSLALFQQQH